MRSGDGSPCGHKMGGFLEPVLKFFFELDDCKHDSGMGSLTAIGDFRFQKAKLKGATTVAALQQLGHQTQRTGARRRHRLRHRRRGVPTTGAGDKHDYEAQCMNANMVILKARSGSEAINGPNSYVDGWAVERFCQVLVSAQTHALNELMFRKKCEEVFGPICRHQCSDVAGLFDQMDYSTFPATPMQGGEGYYLSVRDCSNCLYLNDCTPTPRLPDATLNPRMDFGNQLRPNFDQENVMVPDIIVAAAGREGDVEER